MGQKIPDTVPRHRSVPLPQKCQTPFPACLKGVEYGSKLSQSQLLAGLGNAFSVPVFQATAENILKCFNGQKVNSDSDSDSDSDSEGPWEEHCSDHYNSSVDQFHTPVKKRKFPHASGKSSSLEAAVDEHSALEKGPWGFKPLQAHTLQGR